MKTIYIDICDFKTGKFIFQMPYRHSSLFQPDINNVLNEIHSRRPNLKGKMLSIHIGAERVTLSAQRYKKRSVCYYDSDKG